MLGVRALAHMVQDEPAEAALWAERAARSPRAHALIELIAAVAHEANGDADRARVWTRSALARNPRLTAADFLNAFPLRDPAALKRISGSLQRLPF